MTARAPNSTSERAVNLVQSLVDAGFDVRGVEVDGRKITVLFNGETPDADNDVSAELFELEQAVGG